MGRGQTKGYIGKGRYATTGGCVPANSGTDFWVISEGHAMSVEHRNQFPLLLKEVQALWCGSEG